VKKGEGDREEGEYPRIERMMRIYKKRIVKRKRTTVAAEVRFQARRGYRSRHQFPGGTLSLFAGVGSRFRPVTVGMVVSRM
jgi:hypothetical protein